MESSPFPQPDPVTEKRWWGTHTYYNPDVFRKIEDRINKTGQERLQKPIAIGPSEKSKFTWTTFRIGHVYLDYTALDFMLGFGLVTIPLKAAYVWLRLQAKDLSPENVATAYRYLKKDEQNLKNKSERLGRQVEDLLWDVNNCYSGDTAKKMKQLDRVQTLITEGANVNFKREKHYSIVAVALGLMNYFPDPNIDAAVVQKLDDIAKLLIKNGAQITADMVRRVIQEKKWELFDLICDRVSKKELAKAITDIHIDEEAMKKLKEKEVIIAESMPAVQDQPSTQPVVTSQVSTQALPSIPSPPMVRSSWEPSPAAIAEFEAMCQQIATSSIFTVQRRDLSVSGDGIEQYDSELFGEHQSFSLPFDPSKRSILLFAFGNPTAKNVVPPRYAEDMPFGRDNHGSLVLLNRGEVARVKVQKSDMGLLSLVEQSPLFPPSTEPNLCSYIIIHLPPEAQRDDLDFDKILKVIIKTVNNSKPCIRYHGEGNSNLCVDAMVYALYQGFKILAPKPDA